MPKRKHNESSSLSSSTKGQGGKHAKLSVNEVSVDQQSPFLVAFPGTMPTSEAKFTCYRSSKDAKDTSRQAIVGETDKILFSGSTFGGSAPDNHCKYLVGVYSKKEKTVTLTPAPVVRLRRTVKALQTLDSDARTDKNYAEARKALGMAFGTAKAQKQLKDEERNVVKGEAVEEALQDLHSAIGKTAMPTTEEIKTEMKKALPIPAHNVEAETPEEAYDISSVVTDDELQKIFVKDLLNQIKVEDIKNSLPFRTSRFVNDRVIRLVKSNGKKDRNRLRILVYISYMMAYLIKCSARDVKNRRKVETALGNPSAVIVDKLTERYTDQGVRTSAMTDKILCYLMVLCLSVNNYTVYPEILAKDLSVRPSKLETVLRNLGCKLEKCTVEERASNGLEKQNSKKARLVVPLTFPEVSRGMRT